MDPRLAQHLSAVDLRAADVAALPAEDIGLESLEFEQLAQGGQALKAAYGTVEPDRVAHSLHAYFLRRGDFNATIVYFVDRARDGHSFTSRRVTAIQHGEQIFNLSASFQVQERGFEHQL